MEGFNSRSEADVVRVFEISGYSAVDADALADMMVDDWL